MIPKVIHYCWFGKNEMPDLVKYCIESWKKFCPDYEIVQWSEDNYEIESSVDYVKEAYQNKAWSFVSDYVRLDVVYKNGGVYLDTDVELVKSLDDVLQQECFLAMETSGYISTGLGFGAVRNSQAVKLMLDEYEGIHYMLGKDIFDRTPCPTRNTTPFLTRGFRQTYEVQDLNMCMVYPPEYFCPLDYESKTYKLTQNTISIHHYNESWIDDFEKKLRTELEMYSKRNGRFLMFLFKNKKEFEFKYTEKSITNLWRYIVYKIQKKILEKRVKCHVNKNR